MSFVDTKYKIMETHYVPAPKDMFIANATPAVQSRISAWQKFIAYCESQQHNRLMWVALGIACQGCVMVPITLMCIIINGNNFNLWVSTLIAFVIVEISNLAAMPTKYTIPAFYLALLIEVATISISFI